MESDSASLPWKHWRWPYWEPPESARKTDENLSPWTHRRRAQRPPNNYRKRRRTIWDTEDRCVCVCVCVRVQALPGVVERRSFPVQHCEHTERWGDRTLMADHMFLCVCVCLTEVDAVFGPAPLFRDPPPAAKMLIGCKWADEVRSQWPELPPQMDDWQGLLTNHRRGHGWGHSQEVWFHLFGILNKVVSLITGDLITTIKIVDLKLPGAGRQTGSPDCKPERRPVDRQTGRQAAVEVRWIGHAPYLLSRYRRHC